MSTGNWPGHRMTDEEWQTRVDRLASERDDAVRERDGRLSLNDEQALRNQVVTAEAALALARKIVEQYADKKNWNVAGLFEPDMAFKDGGYLTDHGHIARQALAALTADLQRARAEALEDCAKACREEISRARNFAVFAAKGGTAAMKDAVELVTSGREDSTSRILAAIRRLSLPTDGGQPKETTK